MNIWFVNRISNGGYFVEGGWVREVDPSSGYKRFEFTDELYVAALREIAKLKEASSEIKDDVLKVVYNDSNKYKYLLSEEITKNIINF